MKKKNKTDPSTENTYTTQSGSFIMNGKENKHQFEFKKSVTVENFKLFAKPKTITQFSCNDTSETVSFNNNVDNILQKIKQRSEKANNKVNAPSSNEKKNSTLEFEKDRKTNGGKTNGHVQDMRLKSVSTQSIENNTGKRITNSENKKANNDKELTSNKQNTVVLPEEEKYENLGNLINSNIEKKLKDENQE